MNMMRLVWMFLAAALLAPAVQAAEHALNPNRLSLSARLGFNVSARFKGDALSLPAPANNRLTPGGDAYNFDDGYVLTDISGNYEGQTWYWGYDSSASQISGNTILMSRSTPGGEFASPSFDDDLSWGAELAYNRWLGRYKSMSYGFEFAANWQGLSLGDSSTFYGNATRVRNAFPFTPGTTPPSATPNNPYQGSYGGAGFLIGDTAISSASDVVPGGLEISGRRRYEANLWGFRLGPYLEFPLGERLTFGFSGGLAVGLLDGEASWTDTITVAGKSASSSGSGSDFGVLWGGFASANLSWNFSDRWSAIAGVQYQYLGTYEAEFGERSVELDLRQSFYMLLGVGYRF